MRALLFTLAIVFGVVLTYVVVHLTLIEVGQEIVILHRRGDDGDLDKPRLWIVDEGGSTWLHHGYPDAPWIRQLATEPIVVVERDGQTRRYRGVPDREADPQVHRLLRAKYGAADRLVRFWAGTDTEAGFATRNTCEAVPVRLEPI